MGSAIASIVLACRTDVGEGSEDESMRTGAMFFRRGHVLPLRLFWTEQFIYVYLYICAINRQAPLIVGISSQCCFVYAENTET